MTEEDSALGSSNTAYNHLGDGMLPAYRAKVQSMPKNTLQSLAFHNLIKVSEFSFVHFLLVLKNYSSDFPLLVVQSTIYFHELEEQRMDWFERLKSDLTGANNKYDTFKQESIRMKMDRD